MGNTASVIPDEAERVGKKEKKQARDRPNDGRRKSTASMHAGEGGDGGVVDANSKTLTATPTVSSAQQKNIDEIIGKVLSQSPSSSPSVVMESSKISSGDKVPRERRTSGIKRRRSSLHKRDNQRSPSGGKTITSDVDSGQSRITGTRKNKSVETIVAKEAEAAKSLRGNSDNGCADGGGGGGGGRGSDQDMHCGSSSNSSSLSDGSYTTSSYSGSQDSDDEDDNGSDGTFFIPEVCLVYI